MIDLFECFFNPIALMADQSPSSPATSPPFYIIFGQNRPKQFSEKLEKTSETEEIFQKEGNSHVCISNKKASS